VSQVVTALQDHGADAALGGSGLLAALGLVDAVRDWDVTTDADPAVVEAALQSIGATYDIQTGGDGPYGPARVSSSRPATARFLSPATCDRKCLKTCPSHA